MFFGEFEHSLDDKGRVILPAKFREHVSEGGFITKSDGCLALYTNEEFDRKADEMKEAAKRGRQDRTRVRAFAAGTSEVTPDRQGRIAIPASLRQFARLEGDVMITGAIDRIEIWNASKWDEVNRAGEVLLGEEHTTSVGARPSDRTTDRVT